MADKIENARIRVVIDGKLAETSLRDLESSARKAKSELRSMVSTDPNRAKLLDDFRKLNKTIVDQRKELSDTRTAWQRMTADAKGFFVGTLGANIATSAISSIWGGFKNIIAVQKEFEVSLKSLGSLTGLTGKDLKYMGDEALRVSMNTGIAAKDVLEAYKLIAGAKPELLDQKELLAQVTKETIALSRASGLDLPEAATRLTDAMNQFAIPGEKAGKVVNILAEASRLGSAEVPDVTDALLKFGVAAKASNISVEESVGLIETLAEKGLKGAEAGTQLRNVLAKLSAPETLPRRALAYFEKAGINIDIVKDKTIPFSQRLEELGKITGNTAALIQIFGLENKNAAQVLLENRGRIEELTTALGEDGLTSAYKQAEQNTQTLATAQAKLGATWDVIMTKQGAISSFFKTIIEFLTRAIIQFDNFGAVMDVWANKLTFGLNKINDETYKAAVNMDENLNGYFKKYSQMADVDFLKDPNRFKDEFIKKTLAEGEALEHSEKMWKFYVQKRRQAFLEAHKSKLAAGAAPDAAEDGSAAGLIIKRKDPKAEKSQTEKLAEMFDHLRKFKKKSYEDDLKEADAHGKTELLHARHLLATKQVTQHEFGIIEKNIAINIAREKLAISQKYGEDVLELETEIAVKKGEIDDVEAARIKAHLKKESDEKYAYAELQLQKQMEFATTEDTRLAAEISMIELHMKQQLEVEDLSAQERIRIEEEANFLIEKARRESSARQVQETIRGWEQTRQGLSLINQLFDTGAERQNQKETKEAERRTKALKADLDAKRITQEEYADKINGIEQQLAVAQNERAREAAIRDKFAAIFSIGIDTAQGIMKAVAASPLTGGLPWSAIIGVMGAAQTAAVLSKPLPELYTGGFTEGVGATYNGREIAGVVHPNEFVINEDQLRDPSIMNIANMLEANRTSRTPVVSHSKERFVETKETIKDYEPLNRLTDALNKFNAHLDNGIGIKMDDETRNRWREGMEEMEAFEKRVSF